MYVKLITYEMLLQTLSSESAADLLSSVLETRNYTLVIRLDLHSRAMIACTRCDCNIKWLHCSSSFYEPPCTELATHIIYLNKLIVYLCSIRPAWLSTEVAVTSASLCSTI